MATQPNAEPTEESINEHSPQGLLPADSFDLINRIDDEGEQIKRLLAQMILSGALDPAHSQAFRRQLRSFLSAQFEENDEIGLAELAIPMWIELLRFAEAVENTAEKHQAAETTDADGAGSEESDLFANQSSGERNPDEGDEQEGRLDVMFQ